MTWVLTQHDSFAWNAALVTHHEPAARARRLVNTIDDARIVAEVEQLFAQGKRPSTWDRSGRP
jgi:hypothetical protein